MNAIKHFLSILLFSSLLIMVNQNVLYGQENGEETIEESIEAVEEAEEGSFLEDLNMWELVEQAGPIRYPIFAILFVGIFLISYKVMELWLDSRKATNLRNTPFTDFSLDQISSTISRQPEHMLSVVMAKLLNVFQTNRNADYLHDEISNFAQFRMNGFNSFRNRIDFLSDTAGALGLLGTVWGMFMVFSSGTLERDAILAGMGLALMSTLLGLLVSIVLNFASTLTDGYFTKRLSRVTDKADELRFRLIELSENSSSSFTPAPVNATKDSSKSYDSENSSPKQAISENNKEDNILAEEFKNKSKPDVEKKIVPESEPDEIKLLTDFEKTYQAGSTIKKLRVSLVDTEGEPLAKTKLEVVLQHPGKVNGKSGRSVIETNEKGIAEFDWELAGKAGKQMAGIRCMDKEFHKVREEITVHVSPSAPALIQLINNHQAAVTGSKLPKPVMVVVKDKFDNPVPDTPIVLEVSMGNGEFPNGKMKAEKNTDEEGKLKFAFKLGDEPGFNAVDVQVIGSDVSHKFQAVGQEVTV